MKKVNFVLTISVVLGAFCVETASAQFATRRTEGAGWRRADATELAQAGQTPNGGWRTVAQARPEQSAPRQTERREEAPAPAAPRTPRSGMLVDDLADHSARVNALTPVTIGRPMPFEEMRGSYSGFAGFGGFTLPGSQYPAYSSIQPAKELPSYIQQEMFEEVQRAGEFNPLLPATGHMSQHLDVLEVESRVGNGRDRRTGKPMQIGPEQWSTARYAYVASVGILDEEVVGRQIRGDDIARILDDLGLFRGNRGNWRSIVWDTVGVSRSAKADRKIVGILYLAVVDLETRSVLKASTGIAAVSYTELSAMRTAGYERTRVQYPGAGKFARELVLSALYDSLDRDSAVEKFQRRRQGTTPTPADRKRR